MGEVYVYIDYVREWTSTETVATISTLHIYNSTANMTKGLPICVTNNPLIPDTFNNAALASIWNKSTAKGAVSETTALVIACATNSTTNYNFTYMDSKYNGVRQAMDAGDFDIVVKFSSYKAGMGKQVSYGMCVSPGATGERHGIYCRNLAASSATTAPFTPGKFKTTSSAGATVTAFSSITTMPGIAPLYARINRTGTLLTFYASTNGTTWATNSSQSTCSTASYNLIIGAITCTGSSQTRSTIHVNSVYNYTTNLVTGYVRLEPTTSYAGDKGTRLRVYANDGIIYTACATTS